MIVIAWLEIACLNIFHQGNIIIVFPSQQDMKNSICVIRGGGVGTLANFSWVCAAGLPQPLAYTPNLVFLHS